MAAPWRVLWVSTGGTISKAYDDAAAALLPSLHWRDALARRLRLPHTEVEFRQPFLKDSLEISDEDRAALAREVADGFGAADGILVTHGTDTLADTARALDALLGAPPCPVVLTGAMTPLSVEGSDAVQNLAGAFVALRLLPPGWHVVFHDAVHPGLACRKDRSSGTFRS